MKCYVCGNEHDKIPVLKSELTQKDTAYCPTCLTSGFEPYSDLVNYGFEFELFSPSFRQKIILPTLTLNRKSVEQFNEDVKAALAAKED